MNFQPIFLPEFGGLVLGLWPTFPQMFMKIGAILFQIPWRQTDKQTNRGKNITPSAGKEKGVEITLKTENYLFSLFCMANYFV